MDKKSNSPTLYFINTKFKSHIKQQENNNKRKLHSYTYYIILNMYVIFI